MISCVFIEHFFGNLVLILYRVIHPARVSFGWWSCLCFLKVSHCLFAMYRRLQSIQIFSCGSSLENELC
nr:hypothetical protein CFP56_68998 [Quercus suber]